LCKKSLKISKILSEAINQRRTDNTMAKRQRQDNTMAKIKRTKGTNNNLQNTTQKTKDRATQIPTKKRG